MATDGTPVQEPNLPRVPPVLKDMTNIQRAPGEKSPVKKPGIVIKTVKKEKINLCYMMHLNIQCIAIKSVKFDLIN